MRSDMHKIIVERPRRSASGRRLDKNLPYEHLPQRQGIKRLYKDHKSLNENLAPLRRYLHQQIGRPWDKVYSEIREHISNDNAVQAHILQHLYQWIERSVEVSYVGKRKVIHSLPSDRWFIVNRELRYPTLYVDPCDGLIKQVRQQKVIKYKYELEEKIIAGFRRAERDQRIGAEGNCTSDPNRLADWLELCDGQLYAVFGRLERGYYGIAVRKLLTAQDGVICADVRLLFAMEPYRRAALHSEIAFLRELAATWPQKMRALRQQQAQRAAIKEAQLKLALQRQRQKQKTDKRL